MTVTYRLLDGRTWTFANVDPAIFALTASAIARKQGFIDVGTQGDCLVSPDDSGLIPIVNVSFIEVEVTR